MYHLPHHLPGFPLTKSINCIISFEIKFALSLSSFVSWPDLAYLKLPLEVHSIAPSTEISKHFMNIKS